MAKHHRRPQSLHWPYITER